MAMISRVRRASPKRKSACEIWPEKLKSPNNKGSSRYQSEQNEDLIDLHSFFVGIYPNSSDGFIFIRARNRCFLYTAKYPPWPGDYPEEYMFTPETKELTNRFHSAAALFS